MSARDGYKGIPKKRDLIVNKDKDGEIVSKNGQLLFMTGTATMTSGACTVSGTQIKTTSYAVATPKHGGASALTWATFNGYVIFSGTGTGTIGYTVFI